MLVHSFDTFYAVTKSILPKLNSDNTCAYLDEKSSCDAETKNYTLDHLAVCKKGLNHM